MTLTSAQTAALAHVRSTALRATRSADDVGAVRRDARITLNFHPDRLLADGRTVAECLAADGRYRSQYETGLAGIRASSSPPTARTPWCPAASRHARAG
ncbi:DUF3626 domain-containing protein [Streptomyces hypolithicus]